MVEKKWQTILTELTDEHESKLSEIKKQDFVSFCFELRNVAEDYLKSVRVTRKDDVVALQKKNEGNEKFWNKNYQESLDLYTESIFHAEKTSKNLPLAYANRSLALEKMGNLKESLADIDMAIACGYPKDKMKKLMLRKKNFSDSLHKIRKSQLDKEYQLPKCVGGKNKDFPSASAHLSVYYDKTKGRHVIANSDIKLGEVLFVEKAFAFSVCMKCCMNCRRNTLAPIPCETCLDMTYCSVKCREDSLKSGHSFQCGFGELFKSVGIAHLGLQIVLAASSSFDVLKNKVNSISEPEYKNGVVLLKNKDYENVYNLVHHLDEHEVNDLFQYTMTALLLAQYMRNHTDYFPATSGDEDLKFLTSVILRHILQMICNGHAVTETLMGGFKNSMISSKADIRVATGIFPSVSMMNHSCLPSIITSFYKDYIIVQAAKEIKKGEEVFNCYGASARRMKRNRRQEILSKQYFFNCRCEACLQTYDIHDKLTAFKCITCKGPSVQPDQNVREAVCIDCGSKLQISSELMLKNNKFYSLMNDGDMLLEFDFESSLRKFLEAWKLGREIFYKFHKDVCYAADQVARCFALLRDFKKSASFLKACVVSVEERFGLSSFELIEELSKLLDVQRAHMSSLSTEETSRSCVWKDYNTVQQKYLKVINSLDGNPYFTADN